MDYPCIIHSLSVDHQWQFLDHPWIIHRSRMNYLWIIQGNPLIIHLYPWITLGLPVDY